MLDINCFGKWKDGGKLEAELKEKDNGKIE